MKRLACLAVCAVVAWGACSPALSDEVSPPVTYRLWLNDGQWFRQNQSFTSHDAAKDFWHAVRRGMLHFNRKISDYRIVSEVEEQENTDPDLSGWYVAYDTKEGEPPAVVSVTKTGDDVYHMLWMRGAVLYRGAISQKGNTLAVMWMMGEGKITLQVYELRGAVIVGPGEVWRRLKLPVGDV